MRSKLVFFLAIIMGLITTGMFFQYMQGQGEAKEVIAEPTVTVVTAKDVIQVNQLVTSDMLETVEVPERNIHPLTVLDIAEAEGKFTTSSIEQGEVILSPRLKSDKEEMQFVSRKVQEGYRAVSVGVDFVRSVSTLVEPEDYVDVVFTKSELDKDGEETIKTKILISEVRVLAVGRKMVEPLNDEEAYVEYSAVTLELEPNDASTLIKATHEGTIQFTLHSSLIPAEETDED